MQQTLNPSEGDLRLGALDRSSRSGAGLGRVELAEKARRIGATRAAERTAGTAVGSGPAGGGVDGSVLAEVDVRKLDDLELDARVQDLNRVVGRAKGLIAEALAEKSRRTHKAAILSELCEGVGMSPRKAREALNQAEQLDKLPATREALVNNLINTEHADILGNAAKAGPVDEPKMLKAAQAQAPDKFRETLREHQRELDRDDGAAELERQRKKRFASFTECGDGMWQLLAMFDPVTAAKLRRSLARSGAVWDNRVGHAAIGERHRRADVLADILTGSKPAPANPNPASSGSASTGTGTRPGGPGSEAPGIDASDSGARQPEDVNVCRCQSSEPEPGEARRGRGTGAAARPAVVVVADYDLISGELGNPRFSDGSPLPDDEFHRLACEADILPGLFSSATGEPMWLGRRRHPSPALRAALEARDRGCIGCGTSPEWCISHHITPFAEGGPTQPDNLTLVCHDCHYKIHHKNWQVHKPPDQPHQLRPPGPSP